jgi:hypothetical protein
MNTSTTPTPTVKVGDLFNMSWGYDQTNNNTFQVTRITPKGVYVREIGRKSAGGEGFMCQNVVAVKDNFLDQSQWCGGFGSGNPETFRKLKWSSYSKQWYFTFKGRYSAFPTTETETHYESWYA